MDQTFSCYFMLTIFIVLVRYGAGETQCQHSCQSYGTCNHQQIRETCYYIFKDKRRNWFNSRKFCADQGLSMVKITEDMIQQKQTYDFNGLFEDVPDGLFELGERKTLAWLGGRAFDLSLGLYLNNIRPLEPGLELPQLGPGSNNYLHPGCGVLDRFNGFLQKYYDVCVKLFPFICRFNQTTGSGFDIQIINTPKSWFEARSHCLKLGGDLVYLNEDEPKNLIYNDSRLSNIKDSHHIGVRQRVWEWIDGSEIIFTNWATGEPIESNGKCLLLYGHTGKWGDNECAGDSLTFCQGGQSGPNSLGAGSPPTTPIQSTAIPSNAPNRPGTKIQLYSNDSQMKVLVVILGSLLGVFLILTISLTAFIVYTQCARMSTKPSTADASGYEIPENGIYANHSVLESSRYETLATVN